MANSIRTILCLPLLIIGSSTLAAGDSFYFKGLVQEQKYDELRSGLVEKKPDVLSRDQGLSIFDYALKRRDKRASVIIADYHNKAAHSDELREFYDQLDSVKESLRSREAGKLEEALNKTLLVLKDVREKTEVLQTIQSRDIQDIRARIDNIESDKVDSEDLVKIVQYFDSNRAKLALDIEARSLKQGDDIMELVNRLEASDAALLEQIKLLEMGKVTKEDIDRFIESSVKFEAAQ